MRSDEMVGRLEAMRAEYDALCAESLDAYSDTEVAAVCAEWEAFKRSQGVLDHRIIARLAATPLAELGASSLPGALTDRLRISKSEARRRIVDAEQLGPRQAMTGEPLAPLLPATAAAQARGDISAEHVRIIRTFFDKLPSWIDQQTRSQAEVNLARVASEFGPEHLRAAADQLMLLLHEDGEEPNDAERARKRFVRLGRQQADGMTPINGLLDPEARATLDAVFAKLAAPGMCNPDDETPCVDGEPSEAVAEKDLRSAGQRNHDALKAMGRSVLCSGELGQHNGLPVTIVVSTTLQELESAAGMAVTGGGTLVPMETVIRMASHAHHYLTVFDKHTREPLYLGRTKRCATPGQRIVLYARDRGCTRPGCTVPAYWTQAHHADQDWDEGGQTNITDLGLACKADNLLVENSGWSTRKRKDGRIEWIPPPHLDTGQPRVNHYHHPQEYLVEPDNEDEGE